MNVILHGDKMLEENDEIFGLFKEYKQKIIQDAENNNERVYGIDQMASRLALAYAINKFFIVNSPPTARKVNKTWEEKFDDSAEAEIMQNNFAATSSSANVNVKIKNEKPFITGTETEDGEISWEKNKR